MLQRALGCRSPLMRGGAGSCLGVCMSSHTAAMAKGSATHVLPSGGAFVIPSRRVSTWAGTSPCSSLSLTRRRHVRLGDGRGVVLSRRPAHTSAAGSAPTGAAPPAPAAAASPPPEDSAAAAAADPPATAAAVAAGEAPPSPVVPEQPSPERESAWRRGWRTFKSEGKDFSIFYFPFYAGTFVFFYSAFATGLVSKEAILDYVLSCMGGWVDAEKQKARIAAWDAWVNLGFAIAINELIEVVRLPIVFLIYYVTKPYSNMSARWMAGLFRRLRRTKPADSTK
ncbi:hypothetical protein NESM_000199800 [Novymonas esmeraldas]|uniref:DUF1279 domain-containing protein n=1 Tax=Novymonas esmeraldas TaxID=1808958 RepID=A0AAW0F8J8_9TRYP